MSTSITVYVQSSLNYDHRTHAHLTKLPCIWFIGCGPFLARHLQLVQRVDLQINGNAACNSSNWHELMCFFLRRPTHVTNFLKISDLSLTRQLHLKTFSVVFVINSLWLFLTSLILSDFIYLFYLCTTST